MKNLIESIVLVLLAVVLPLAGALELVLTWPAIAVAAIGLIMLYTQPEVPNKSDVESNNNTDRNSAFLLLGSSLVAYQIVLMDAAYLQQKFPEINQISTWIGLAIMTYSMFYRWYVINYLGKFFTAQVTILSDHKLIKEGPYSVLRHPSYTAAFLTFTGISIMFQSWIGLTYVIFIYFPIQNFRIRLEEKALKDKFKEEYTDYMKSTKRMFPFVW